MAQGTRTAAPQGSVSAFLAVLGRFVSCGVLSLAGGLGWRLTLAPQQLDPATSLVGVMSLLLGFIVGGMAWYVRDAVRVRRHPGSIDDERIVFSFIVFVLMPLGVLLLVGLVALISAVIGG